MTYFRKAKQYWRSCVDMRCHTVIAGFVVGFFVFQGNSLYANEIGISTDTPARVRVENNTIFYNGDISKKSWEAFSNAVANKTITDVRKIVINSGGGDTIYGRKLGAWVLKRNMIVEVEGGCFSSCANYVFVAGRKKLIRQGAFVGWHGSEAQQRIDGFSFHETLVDGINGISGENFLRTKLYEANLLHYPDLEAVKELDAAVERAYRLSMERMEKSLANEDMFFEKLGLNNTFTIYGLLPEQLKRLEDSGKRGWTFSLEDMKRLGITDVHYLGLEEYQMTPNVRKHLIVYKLAPPQT